MSSTLAQELERAQKENAKLKAELEETRNASNRYLQNVAHQLTAPLGAIKWSIEALKDERVPIQRKGTLLSSVYSQATILVHLIKNFTLMSNLEADHELGQFREKPEAIDMMRLAINLANDFQPQAHDREIDITVDNASFSEAFGSRKLMIEKNLTAQAISNVLENAVKYADGSSTIEIWARSEGDFVSVAIASSGIPISAEDAKRIFDRGFRGDSAIQKVPAGTGIGLFLANRVAVFHGGDIQIETHGKHSEFVFRLPKSRMTSDS
jgi:two-component system OmpR family sensor kinase